MNSPKAAMKLLGANRSSPSEKYQSVPVGPLMVSTCKKSYRPERTTMKGADSKHRHSLRAFVHNEISFKTILRRFCKKTQHVHDSKKLTYDSEDVFIGTLLFIFSRHGNFVHVLAVGFPSGQCTSLDAHTYDNGREHNPCELGPAGTE